jgi:GTP-binding protein
VDVDMYKYLLELGLPITIVLSKADKISKNELGKSKLHAAQVFFGQEIIPVSSLKKQGVDDLRKILKNALLSK